MRTRIPEHISRTKQVLCAIMILVLVCILAFPLGARAEESTITDEALGSPSRVVKVAYYPDHKYMSADADGNYVGYNVDFLYEIARYTKWTYEYVLFDTPVDAYRATIAGEVDIFPAVHRSPGREETLLFSDRTMGETYVSLAVREDETRFAFEDFDALDSATIGCVNGSTDAQLFAEYCQKNDITATVTYFDNLTKMLESLNNKEIDCIATNYLGNDSPLRVVARFSPDPIYLTFPQDRTDIKQSVDEAMEALLLRDPTYPAKIYERYFAENPAQEPLFRAEEYEFIKASGPLTVVFETGRMPLSSQSSSGNFEGVTASLFESISEKTGLQFEYVGASTYDDAIGMMENGQADIIYAAHEESIKEAQKEIDLTGAYLTSYIAQVTGTNPYGDRIAMPKGHQLPKEITDARPLYKVTQYDTARECLDAVVNQAADVAYIDTHVGGYCLNEPRYDSLEMVALTHVSFDIAIGVAQSQDPRLVYILDRAIQYTPRSEVSQWVSESSTAPHPITLSELMRLYPLHFFLIILVLALVIVSVTFYIFYARSRSKQRIDELSYGDALTKGWNLTRFQAEAEQVIQGKRGQQFAILYFDISRFKSFNAAFGFAQGDKLLISISELLKDFTYEGEVFARITADEFVVLTVWEGWQKFVTRFERFDEALNNLEVLTSKGYRVLLVGGVRHIDSNRLGDGENTLSEYIDDARYARETVEETTRSRAVLYTPNMKRQDVAKQELFNEAEAAMRKGEFLAYYQPKVEIKTNMIVGFEALARWESSTKGMRSPDEFIPVFESNGFVLTLDFYIFRLTCERIRMRLNEGKTVVPIGCNFSRQHLKFNDFPEKVKAIADEYNVPANYLGIELTENIVMDDFERAKTTCIRLKSLGFSVLVDDFGKGYSSLGTLQDLPVDVLKLDQSFLQSSEADDNTTAVLEGAVQIAHAIGLEVVVEGVETQKQADMLVEFDSHIVAQGYLYSRPVPLLESENQLDKKYLHPHES